LSNCVVANLFNPSGSASYPLTYYTLSCSAKIYYKTRCSDSAASYGLSYSSSQKNSACRQQRLNRINTCLNSTVQISNVPCLISVSSGLVTYASGTCAQSVTSTSTVYYSPSLINEVSTQTLTNTNQVVDNVPSLLNMIVFQLNEFYLLIVYLFFSIICFIFIIIMKIKLSLICWFVIN